MKIILQIIWFAAVILMVGVWSVSCETFRRAEVVDEAVQAEVRNWRPQVFVTYYPYEKHEVRPADARPVPDYYGWTDNRMTLDISRMRQVGIRGVLVSLTPVQLASGDVVERFRVFCTEAEKAGMVVSLLLGNEDGKMVRIEAGNLMEYLEKSELVTHQAFWHRGQTPVVCYDGNSVALLNATDTNKVNFMAVAGKPQTVTDTACQVVWNGYSAGCMETSAKAQTEKWPIPRLHGREFVRQLKQAASNGGDCLVIQSWNSYRTGSFLENNSLDGMETAKVLQRLFAEPEAEKRP